MQKKLTVVKGDLGIRGQCEAVKLLESIQRDQVERCDEEDRLSLYIHYSTKVRLLP